MSGYILDFACLRAQLGIEIDGDHHGIGDQRRHDAVRDAALARAGLRVVRFWNDEVDTNLSGVVEAIRAAAEQGLQAERMRDRRHEPTWP